MWNKHERIDLSTEHSIKKTPYEELKDNILFT